MLPPLGKDSLVLDIGAGRGLWAMKLAEMGYRVLGIDYVESIVQKVNKNIADEGYSDRARFVTADALDIPFVDKGFKLVTDVGTLQHITADKWQNYTDEVHRVLADDGYYLKISLSKRTHQFMGWNPKNSETGDFTKFGVHYHFFTEQEIDDIFSGDFVVVDQQFQTYGSTSDPGDQVVLVFTLMQKK
jgi:cyclopropane fatty-acyl-phospholipid synthase-like methyltransferase